ncbi:MAG TPA: hypothetical protein VFF98_02815 [Novosphingobium sp.]|nr:hypothetical protein [Novosphingobium sp.]
MNKTTVKSFFEHHKDRFVLAFLYILIEALTNNPRVFVAARAAKWESWADQGSYFRSAHAFLQGNLDPAMHWYPLVYALILAPFSWLPPFYAALIPDLALIIGCLVGFQMVAQRFGLSRWQALALFLPATLVYPHTGDSWLVPWTTTPSAAFIWLSLGLAFRLEEGRRAPAEALGLGVLLGLIPLVRPGDALITAMVGLCLLKPLLIDARRWPELGAICLGGLAVILPYGALHVAIYGLHPSAYMALSGAYGLNLGRLGWKAYLIFIEPRPWYPYGDGVLKRLPWFALGAAGLLVAACRKGRRWQVAVLALPALAYSAVMLAYIDLLPAGLWRFNNIHYFKWIFLLLALFCWTFLRDLKHHPRLSLAAFLCVMLPAALRLEPVPATTGEPARLAVFPAGVTEFADTYFSDIVLEDNAGHQVSSFDFHPVPDQAGLVLAEALRRDFAGNERLRPRLPADHWPVEGAAIRNTARLPAVPQGAIARYRPALALGWPCWLPPYGCPASLPAASVPAPAP